MNRNIIIWPDSVLKRPCELVKEVDDDVRKLLDDMAETMVSARGAGLAAPQVGFSLRCIVILVEKLAPKTGEPLTTTTHEIIRLVNPVITKRSAEMMEVKEACLSVPGVVERTSRHKSVTVRALDERGDQVEIEGDGMLAIALQHEIDHLDGKMHIDQLSKLKRDILAKKFTKAKKQGMRYVFPAPAPQDFTAQPH